MVNEGGRIGDGEIGRIIAAAQITGTGNRHGASTDGGRTSIIIGPRQYDRALTGDEQTRSGGVFTDVALDEVGIAESVGAQLGGAAGGVQNDFPGGGDGEGLRGDAGFSIERGAIGDDDGIGGVAEAGILLRGQHAGGDQHIAGEWLGIGIIAKGQFARAGFVKALGAVDDRVEKGAAAGHVDDRYAARNRRLELLAGTGTVDTADDAAAAV